MKPKITEYKGNALTRSRDLRVGYWNIKKKKTAEIGPYISDLLLTKDLDLLLLSEFENFEPNDILSSEYMIIAPGPTCKKVLAITKRDLDFRVVTDGNRFVLLLSYKYHCALVGLHLRDNTYGENQDLDRRDTLLEILEGLSTTKEEHHVLVGDFNCLPTDREMTDTKGLHAVLFRGELDTEGGVKPKHYNPILLSLNEEHLNYGSYRYTKDQCRLYWYPYDQVVVSRSLADSISNVEYLRSIRDKSLMSPRGISPSVSDHLPLVFVIKELRYEQ